MPSWDIFRPLPWTPTMAMVWWGGNNMQMKWAVHQLVEGLGRNWDRCTSGTNRKNTLSIQELSSLSPRAQGEADLTFQLNEFLENIAIGLDPLGRDWSYSSPVLERKFWKSGMQTWHWPCALREGSCLTWRVGPIQKRKEERESKQQV